MPKCFPAHFAVASHPLQIKNGWEMLMRVIKKQIKCTYARNRDSSSQTTLNKFMNLSQNIADSSEREEGEINLE